MLSFDGLACGYNQAPIVSNFSRSVLAGQRIGILAPTARASRRSSRRSQAPCR
jgi:hypothetical protein